MYVIHIHGLIFYIYMKKISPWPCSDCLRLSFMDILKKELTQVAYEWNTHPIRPYRSGGSPPGVLEELFFMPSVSGKYQF